MPLPGNAEIRELHERYAPHRAAFDLVYTHCEIVCRIAEQLAVALPAGSRCGRLALPE